MAGGLSSSTAQPRPQRTSLAAVREAATAGRRDRVLVRATVTRVREGGITFMQDESAGIALLAATPPVQLEPGQVVEVEGHSSRSTRGPAVAPTRITISGRGALPAALPLDWQQLRAGVLDARLVEVKGIARRSMTRGGGVLVRLMTDEGPLEVDIPPDAQPSRLEVDARATVKGVLAPIAAVDGRTIGYELLVPSVAEIRVDEAGPADPFSLPVTRREDLAALPAKSSHRLRVDGVVTRHRPGQSLYLQDPSGSLYVETDLELPLEVGDRVEVVGFPMLDQFTPYLTEASYRRVSGGAPPLPVSATPPELASGLHDAALVRTEARLVDAERSQDDLQLVLQDREIVFHARVPGDRAGALESRLRPGSDLRITGVASVIVDADRRPRAFRLLLRDAGDVEVVREQAAPAGSAAPAWGWLAVAAAIAAIGGFGVYYRRSGTRERTIRRQMAREASLKASFDDLFERTADIMVVHDRRGRVSTINRTGEQLSGFPREETRMLHPSWLFSQKYNDTIQRMIHEGVDAAPRTIRAELITRKSARVPIEAHARLLVGDGQVTGVTVVARNMAERDQLETQLRQAQKMEAVGRLATGIAHDFNNLITVLLGYSDELMESVDPGSPLRKPVQEVHRAVVRASGLTQQLLAFSRRKPTAPQQIDLNVAVSNMRDLLKRLLGPEIKLEVHLDPALALVQADPVQVGQIIMNLAVNARDAMLQGGTLAIATSNVELGAEHLDVIPGAHVLLEVRDTGVGMTQDVQRRLFEPFFTTKDLGQGTGLGLSMVDAIVRQSGGHITVTSAPGKGSTFHVYFPRAEAPPSDVSSAAAPKAAPAPAPPRGSAVVLLAEDDRQVRRLMVSELRRQGFTVLEARHGGEALEICKQYGGDIDVLVTDVVMPTMNGVDLASAATPLRPEMRVLFMSGHPERAGVGLDPDGPQGEHLLVKPFSPSVLVNRINEILAAKAQ